MNQFSRNIILWIFLVAMISVMYGAFDQSLAKPPEKIPYSDFRQAIMDGKIKEVIIKEEVIEGEYKQGYSDGLTDTFTTYPVADDAELVKDLREQGVKFNGQAKEQESWYLIFLANWFPMLLLIGVWIFFMRQIHTGGGKALSFGKSKAKLLEEGKTKVTFDDVAGIEESKSELESIVQL